MEIHQVLVSASPGDAITNAAFEIRSLLRQVGPSEIYARYFDASLAGEVIPLDRYGRRPGADPEADIICFHASIGQPDVFAFLMERPERLVLVYHNISPAEAFRDYDPAFAGYLDAGRQELTELASRTHLALAVSAYNAAELEELGYREVRVSPLIIDPGRLHDIEPHAPTATHLAEQVEGPLILFVGQLLPHKRPDLVVKAFHVLVTHLLPEAKLALVGMGRLAAYRQSVQLLVHELNLVGAWLTGPVSDAELAAYYARADVLVTASEHEGFCVPLVEAMSFDLPIVARSYGAVPETMGEAGLLLPPDDDPLLMAEAMAMVLTEQPVRNALVERGRRRLAAFAPDKACATFLGNLLEIA